MVVSRYTDAGSEPGAASAVIAALFLPGARFRREAGRPNHLLVFIVFVAGQIVINPFQDMVTGTA